MMLVVHAALQCVPIHRECPNLFSIGPPTQFPTRVFPTCTVDLESLVSSEYWSAKPTSEQMILFCLLLTSMCIRVPLFLISTRIADP